MPSFTTIIETDGAGVVTKYDNYNTELAASDRVVWLKANGVPDAFYVEDNPSGPDNVTIAGQPRHQIADKVAKTVTLDQAGLTARLDQKAMRRLRRRRNALLLKSDGSQIGDHPDSGSPAWLTYRQSLRDYPSTVVEPRNPPPFPLKPGP